MENSTLQVYSILQIAYFHAHDIRHVELYNLITCIMVLLRIEMISPIDVFPIFSFTAGLAYFKMKFIHFRKEKFRFITIRSDETIHGGYQTKL